MAKTCINTFRLLILLYFWSYAAGTTLLKPGDALDSNSALVSSNGYFTLNFTKLHNSVSEDKWYLAIWYVKNIGLTKPCWLANRNNPITSSRPVLVLDQQGSLTINSTSGSPIKLYSSPSKSDVIAILEDNGNFVLKETNSGGQIFWQSFDYPTDTFFPGMKLGINHKTGQKWLLTSWFTEYLPSPGSFTLEWEPSERQLVIKRRNVRFWTSGVLEDNGMFVNIKVFGEVFAYNFTQHSSSEEDCITVHLSKLFPDFDFYADRKNISLLSLEHDGTMNRYNDLNGLSSFVIADACNGTSTESGCERWEGPQCRSDGDAFQRKEVNFNFAVPFKSEENRNLSFSDCMNKCWNDCTCVGVSANVQGDPDNPGCKYWFGRLTKLRTGKKEE